MSSVKLIAIKQCSGSLSDNATRTAVKGFTLDNGRIKAGRTLGDDYFEELLARIR